MRSRIHFHIYHRNDRQDMADHSVALASLVYNCTHHLLDRKYHCFDNYTPLYNLHQSVLLHKLKVL